MARRRDQLAPRVEQLLEARRHLVEGTADVRELARARRGRARVEIAAGDPPRGTRERGDPASETAADQERGRHGRRRGGGRDREHLHVVVHVEHDEPGEDHRHERQCDREQRQAGELEAHGRQPAQDEGEREPGRERAERDREREGGHGVRR